MFGLFKKKEENQANPAAPDAPAPNPQGGIRYYPNLIQELVGDHRKLHALREHIFDSFTRRDLKSIAKDLKEFGALVRNHLLTENMRLYIYLQQKMANDEVNTSLVRSFRKEMDGIAKTALDFLDKYKDIETQSASELVTFTQELDKIGSVVDERMQREEATLYPLYAENY